MIMKNPEEIAAKHFPMNTTCPLKKKKILYQREQLANDIKDYYISVIIKDVDKESFQDRQNLERK